MGDDSWFTTIGHPWRLEFLAQGERMLGDDCLLLVREVRWQDDGLHFGIEVEPGPAIVDDVHGKWHIPPREILMELLARTYRVRSLRVDLGTSVVPPLPEDWDLILQTHFPIFRGSGMSFDAGWGDMLMAMAGWLAEVAPDMEPFTQTKEKYGGLRLYFPPQDGGARDIVESAEFLAEYICEVCGAPGENREDRGWYKTTCDRHRLT